MAVTGAAMLTLNATALEITAANADYQGTIPTNPNAGDIATITGSSTLSLLYKSDGEGSFLNSYTTIFSGGNESAQVIYDGGGDPSIPSQDDLWLVIKDGVNNNPIWYIWDLSASGLNWNGTETLDIGVLWPQQGAISHVGIYGGGGTNQVPEGGSTAILLGTALVGIGAFRRRFSKS
jgi:hypothetical protein